MTWCALDLLQTVCQAKPWIPGPDLCILYAMLYTIGYAKLTPALLVKTLDRFSIATLVDVRSSPRTRVAGFGNRQLETLLGPRYAYRGNELGGRPPGVSERGLLWLAHLAACNEAVGDHTAIMCMEEAPGDCHRHHTISLQMVARRAADVRHIYRNELIEATELQRAIDTDTDYDCDLFELS